MNYRLSCSSLRPVGKNGFILERGGREVSSLVFSFRGSNIKENLLEVIYRGLKVAKTVIVHEDLLVVEVQNIHLANWLSGLTEYHGYEEGLDRVFDLLESMDCKYKFVFCKEPYAKGYTLATPLTKLKVSGLEDAFGDLK